MKRFGLWVLAATLICGATVFTSCEGIIDNTVPTQKKYRLVQRKQVYSDTDADVYYITDYGYDDQGRLKSYTRTGYNVDDIVAKFTYTYGDHYIIENRGDYSFYLTLNDDGLIVKHDHITTEDGVETITPNYLFGYGDGRLLTYEELEVNSLENFHWENGDLMYYMKDNMESSVSMTEYTRSGQSVDNGYTNCPLSTMSEGLYLMGYYGKPSKHLESHHKTTATTAKSNVIMEDDYTYTVADGHVVEMVDNASVIAKMGIIEYKTERTITTTFTYEEY